MTIHDKHSNFLETRGISLELALMLGLETTTGNGGNWLSTPYRHHGRVVNHKHRQVSTKRFMMDAGAPLLLWNRDILDDDTIADEPLVITEGELDAMAAMMAGKARVVSVPNGAPGVDDDSSAALSSVEGGKRYQYLWRDVEKLDKVTSIVIAVDNDGPGLHLASDLARWFGPERCRWVQYPDGCKDLNDVLVKHDAATVSRILDSAKPYPIKGIYRLSDFPEPPPYKRISTGIAALDDMMAIVPGTLTVWTGYAGMGKSSLMMSVLAAVMHQGHNIALASFETAVKPILQRKLRAALAKRPEFGLDDETRAYCDEVLENQLSVIAQNVDDEDLEMDLEYVLTLAKMAVRRDGIRVLVIDPWNEIEHKRRRDETETDYIGRAIRTLKAFARQNDVAVIVVAHPAKPDPTRKMSPPGLYSISGSSNWANKADYGVVVHRSEPDPDIWLCDVMVTKVRMGMPGKQGSTVLTFDRNTSSYSRAEFNGQPLT